MDQEACIIKNVINNNNFNQRVKESNCSSLTGEFEDQLMSAGTKLNQALLVSLDSQNISSVIQQAKDVKLNSFSPGNACSDHFNGKLIT